MSPELQAKLDVGRVTLCRVWEITRTDSVVLLLTDRDIDVLADGDLYLARSGLKYTAIELVEGLSPSNVDISGHFDDAGVSLQDYLLGKFSNASVRVGLADWENSLEPVEWVIKGMMGKITRDRNAFEAQCNGTTRLFERSIKQVTSPTCRAQLGDARCKVVLTPWTFARTVATVTSRRVFTMNTTLADGTLDYGKLTFTSGANNGRSMEIKKQVGVSLELYLPMPSTVAIGDTFSAVAGCDLLPATCKNKFSNRDNFRGEDDLPGVDRMTEPNQNFS